MIAMALVTPEDRRFHRAQPSTAASSSRPLGMDTTRAPGDRAVPDHRRCRLGRMVGVAVGTVRRPRLHGARQPAPGEGRGDRRPRVAAGDAPAAGGSRRRVRAPRVDALDCRRAGESRAAVDARRRGRRAPSDRHGTPGRPARPRRCVRPGDRRLRTPVRRLRPADHRRARCRRRRADRRRTPAPSRGARGACLGLPDIDGAAPRPAHARVAGRRGRSAPMRS